MTKTTSRSIEVAVPVGVFVPDGILSDAEHIALREFDSELRDLLAIGNQFTGATLRKRIALAIAAHQRTPSIATLEDLALALDLDPKDIIKARQRDVLKHATDKAARTLFDQKAYPILGAVFKRAIAAYQAELQAQKTREEEWKSLAAVFVEWGRFYGWSHPPLSSFISDALASHIKRLGVEHTQLRDFKKWGDAVPADILNIRLAILRIHIEPPVDAE